METGKHGYTVVHVRESGLGGSSHVTSRRQADAYIRTLKAAREVQVIILLDGIAGRRLLRWARPGEAL